MRRRFGVRTAPRPGLLAALVMLGCGARPVPPAPPRAIDELRLYRDRALVTQRIAIDVASAGRTIVMLRVAGDVGPAGVAILERGGLLGAAVHLAPGAEPPVEDVLGEPEAAPIDAGAGPIARPDDPLAPDGGPNAEMSPDVEAAALEMVVEAAAADEAVRAAHVAPVLTVPHAASALQLVVDAPRAGRFVVVIGYATRLVRWDAAYTVTTGPAHDRATVRGALTIASAAGVALHGQARVVDGELGADRLADRVRAAWRAPVLGRALGDLALADGETHVALLAAGPPRALRSVLVYDAIGPELDHPGAAPAADPDLGARTHRTTRITESVELSRDPGDRALPGGAGKLIEARDDGSQIALGQARLFDPTTAAAPVETIAVGAATGVRGHRERRDWAKNDDQHRFSEEFLLTIDNARPRPVEVVIREHLYRGQNWTLAYHSTPAAKEGAQQIALHAAVPANGQAKVLYVVVYTW